MAGKSDDVLILAIDGGTTNTRVRLVAGQTVVAEASRGFGARDRAAGRSPADWRLVIVEAARETLASAEISPEGVSIWVAAGMLTSNVGITNVPHQFAPIRFSELAAKLEKMILPDFARPVTFVPGVRAAASADAPFGEMMRGEECEVVGLFQAHRPPLPAIVILPGSHVKAILLEGDRDDPAITWIRTSLVGEMIAALSEHTVLAGSVPHPLPLNPSWEDVLAGSQLARELGLLSASFQVRAAQVLASRSKESCAGLLLGMIVGSDVARLARLMASRSVASVIVGGSEPLRGAYARLLEVSSDIRGLSMVVADDAAARHAGAFGAAHLIRERLNLR